MEDWSRRHIIRAAVPAFASLACPSIIRAQTSASKHFFAGCYYDTGMSENSLMSKHLIAPIRNGMGLTQDGAEMTPLVRGIVEGNKGFANIAGLTDSEGNPVAISVTRAQHEVISVLTPGLPAEYLTTISVSAALDVMTDQAAFRNQKRFESIYSNLIIVNQVIHGRNRVSDADLAKHYASTFRAAVEELLERAAKSLRDKRDRASAVFQVNNMVLPNPLPLDLEALIVSGVEASADKNPDARAEELKKLTRELKHIYSLMILDALDKAKINNVAILPPESPWAESRVLSRLKDRIGIPTTEILTQPDATRMNGYEIRAGVTGLSRERAGSTSQINVAMGSRIVRRKSGDQVEHMPLSIADPVKKVAVAAGSGAFIEMPSFKRGVTRDITMTAYRDAARSTAIALVPFLKATANEI